MLAGRLVHAAVAMSLVLAAAIPGWAHGLASDPPRARVVEPHAAPREAAAASADSWLTAAPEPPGLPRAALLVAAVAIALGRRRPRHTLAACLVVVLAIFAFEAGLHSVHHGLDSSAAASCATAAVATDLNATPIDQSPPGDVILAVDSVASEAREARAPARVVSRDRTRAPPSALR